MAWSRASQAASSCSGSGGAGIRRFATNSWTRAGRQAASRARPPGPCLSSGIGYWGEQRTVQCLRCLQHLAGCGRRPVARISDCAPRDCGPTPIRLRKAVHRAAELAGAAGKPDPARRALFPNRPEIGLEARFTQAGGVCIKEQDFVVAEPRLDIGKIDGGRFLQIGRSLGIRWRVSRRSL